mgnify:FL=1
MGGSTRSAKQLPSVTDELRNLIEEIVQEKTRELTQELALLRREITMLRDTNNVLVKEISKSTDAVSKLLENQVLKSNEAKSEGILYLNPDTDTNILQKTNHEKDIDKNYVKMPRKDQNSSRKTNTGNYKIIGTKMPNALDTSISDDQTFSAVTVKCGYM